MFTPYKEVEEEEDGEDQAGEPESCHDGVELPVDAFTHFVESRGEITGEDPHKDEEEQHGGDEAT